jgi:hypothetical protein
MPTIGTDCHVTIKHEDINGGVAYGFLVDPRGSWPEGVVIKREVYTEESEPMKVWIYFDVILADNLRNPDGSKHADTRQAMYTKLVEYLEKQKGIMVTFALGALTNLGAIEYAATERHFPGYSSIRVQLTNAGAYFGVVSGADFDNSFWDGVLTWDTSYWR